TKLASYENRADVLVLALPRGGVPVAFEVAKKLRAPLDILIVRKLGLPGQEELAMGAIASGGTIVVNERVVDQLGLTAEVLESVAKEERKELTRRELLYRQGRDACPIADKQVILVDDGLATGASMRAAVLAVAEARPARIVIAVPVAAEETCAEFRDFD